MISRLHLVTDDEVLGAEGFEGRAHEAMEAGAGKITLHLRGPRTAVRHLWDVAERLAPRARRFGVPLLVNDRVDVAMALGLDGVHLGERSFPVATARRLLALGVRSAATVVGRSFHDPEEARRSVGLEGAPDFCLVGTLFATPSHPGREGSGSSRVVEMAEAVPGIPLIGIGGIDRSRLPEVFTAGAHGVAVVRAAWAAEHPGRAVTGLLESIADSTGRGSDE